MQLLFSGVLALTLALGSPLGFAQEPLRVTFAGSSTIENWKTLAPDFPEWRTRNLGRGGTTYADLLRDYATWLRPALPATDLLVLYSGDNDLANRSAPERVLADVRTLLAAIHRDRPQTRVLLLTVKLSPARMALRTEIQNLNALLRKEATETRGFSITEMEQLLCDAQGSPLGLFFIKDGLHLSPAGYALWRDAVRQTFLAKEVTAPAQNSDLRM